MAPEWVSVGHEREAASLEQRVQSAIRALRAQLEGLYETRLVHLILFGSQVCGDAEEGSDVDVLVVLRGEVRPVEEISRTIDTVADLSLDYGVVINCVFVSADRYVSERSPLLMNVHREGVAV